MRRRIVELERAVVRIGQQRLGEFALAAATRSALTEKTLPWMNMQTIWRQSVAAGVAVEHLVVQGNHGTAGDSLALIAIMHSLGRVVLGTLYPDHYCHLVQQCSDQDEALIEQEQQVFPEHHARIMARLLSGWSIPDEICNPMNYILDSYAAVSRLSDPTRTRVELLKLAVFIGQLATRAWHPWDLVEIPPSTLLQRLRIHDVRNILDHTRDDTQAVIDFKLGSSAQTHEEVSETTTKSEQTIYYENVSTLPFDFIAEFIRSLDICIVSTPPDSRARCSKLVINSIGVSQENLPPTFPFPSSASLLIVTDNEKALGSGGQFRILNTPASYSKLRSAMLREAASKPQQAAAADASFDVQV